LATPVASVPEELVSGPLRGADPVQPLPGVGVGAVVGVAVGAVVGVAVGPAVGVAVGLAVGDGDGLGVLVPPLSVSAVESMKKSVARLPPCLDV